MAKRIVIVFRHLFGGFGGLEACFGSLVVLCMANCGGESLVCVLWKEIDADFLEPKVLLTIFGWMVIRCLNFRSLSKLFHVRLVRFVLGSSTQNVLNIP